MNSIARFGAMNVYKSCYVIVLSRKLCDSSFDSDKIDCEFYYSEEPLKRMWKGSSFHSVFDETPDNFGWYESGSEGHFSTRQGFFESGRGDARKILEVLEQDGPGFDAKAVLSELQMRVSGFLIREVLKGVLKNINYANKTRCVKLAYKFFMWSDQQVTYRHSANSYHLIMKIFAECEEYTAMWRRVDEMIQKGFPKTARTFNILICTCGEAGLARKVVERFIKSKTFNYRPFKHSYNAILHTLLAVNQYKLIEGVYQQMLADGFAPDTLTYNILMCAKYRLGKLDQFHRLLDERVEVDFPLSFII
ncbi:hypothetical protein REPUB_Repub08aG0123400 [Reevesia pubescens]